jgi:YD repeat-containing protein
MTRIDFAAGGNSYYDYDADSKRVSQRTADGFRQFVYQGPDMLKLQLERDESETTMKHYTMGAGLEAMRRDTSSFYHYNHPGMDTGACPLRLRQEPTQQASSTRTSIVGYSG